MIKNISQIKNQLSLITALTLGFNAAESNTRLKKTLRDTVLETTRERALSSPIWLTPTKEKEI